MQLFKEILISESEKASRLEVSNNINIINSVYNEWKKTKRRINAVDIITTSVNKISKINPESIHLLHDAGKLKLTTIIMRSLDLPPWKPVDSKKQIYKKLYPLIKALQKNDPNTGSGGNLREVIMTRFSSAISYSSKDEVFVAYEPVISKSYLRYLFSDETPKKTFKMQAMSLPEDFESLIDTLKANHKKATKKFNSK